MLPVAVALLFAADPTTPGGTPLSLASPASSTSSVSAPVSTALFGATAGMDVDVTVSTEIESALLATNTVALQAHDATRGFLEAAKGLGVDCDPTFDECLLQLASVCTVKQALLPRLDGNRLTFRLALTDGAVVRQSVVTLSDDTLVRRTEVREAIASLFAPAASASLVVDAPSGSDVSLDGLVRGKAPLAALSGIAPGEHVVDVRFVDGATWNAHITLDAGRRTRIIATPRPFVADALTWGGGGTIGVAAIAAGIATYSAAVYLVARGDLEDFSTHYARDRDYNDARVRQQALLDQDHLTDLPTYGVPLFVTAGVLGAVGVACTAVGMKWSALFDPAPAETPQ